MNFLPKRTFVDREDFRINFVKADSFFLAHIGKPEMTQPSKQQRDGCQMFGSQC